MRSSAAKESGSRKKFVTEISKSCKQRARLARVRAQIDEVAGQIGESVHLHPARDAAEDGGALVVGKIAPRPRAQKGQHIAQRRLVLVRRKLGWLRGVRPVLGGQLQLSAVLHVGEQPRGHLLHPEHPIHHARGDGRARHVGVLRLVGVLRDGQPAEFLDPLQPERPVAARAGEDHRHGLRSVCLRQRAEKVVHRHAFPARFLRVGQAQMPIGRGEKLARRDHIHGVRLHRGAVRRHDHRHRRGALEHLRQRALVLRRKMQDDHESHPGIHRHRRKEFLQRPDAARRPAEPDNRQHGKAPGRHRVVGLLSKRLLRYVRGNDRKTVLSGRSSG